MAQNPKLPEAAKRLMDEADRLKFEADVSRAAHLPGLEKAMRDRGINKPESSEEE